MNTTALHVASLVLVTTVASAQTVTFELIPNASGANDMSPDGRFVVGETTSGGNYIWDRVLDTFTTLPAANDAVAVSDDGEYVVGCILNPEGDGAEVAARWSRTTNTWASLGYLPNALMCPSRSNAYEISADGGTVVGLSWDGCSGRGFIWTEAMGIQELMNLANGGNRASVVSADGTVIGGFAQGSFSRTPAAWDDTTAGMLLDPPNGDALGEVYGLSDDGSILLGDWNGDAFKQVNGGAIEVIGSGQLIPGWDGIAMDIADNGTIVGFDFLVGNRRAWIQPGGTGDLVLLQQYIVDHGGTIPVGVSLEVCQAISTDGSVIIGHSFITGAWIVTIEPGPCAADITGSTPGESDGNVDALDFLLMIAQWGTPCVGSCEADITGPTPNVPDGNVDSLDFLLLIAQWGSPGNCPTP